MDAKSLSPKKGDFDLVESIKSPNPLTVIIKLKERSAAFLENLTVGIVPNHSNDLTSRPIGAGPFVFENYKRGELLKLKSFKYYIEGSPKLDGVIFKVLPDETVRLLELKKGNVHIVSLIKFNRLK